MERKWWQDTVVYQIYPKSFMDTNGDGIGDLRGIIGRLDYIKSLGVNVIWLSPINRSPMRDNGYDISDYYQVDPSFGTNKDLEELIREANQRGLKVLLDLVVNHVSVEHKWFQEMLKNPDSPYGDYFIIRETEDGKEPNNFRSYFGGSVWERIGDSNRFYFHAFAKEQPDLNWENPKLRQEIYDMMTYWQEKGIAGFRVDAIGNIKKSETILSNCRMPADAEDGLCDIHAYVINQPGIGEFLGEMRDQVFKRFDSMTVAEIVVPEKDLEAYIGDNGYFSMVFDFSYADIDTNGITRPCDFAKWNLEDLKRCIFTSQENYQKYGWAAPYLENHDQPRSLDKYLEDGEINYYSTTMLGTLYFFLRGTPYLYQGQELGMSNYPFADISEFKDIDALNKYEKAKEMGDSEEKILDFLRRRSRDNARTPMQWSKAPNAGFSKGTPWLAVNPNYSQVNVESEETEEQSVLHFYRDMIRLRRTSEYRDTLVYGRFEGIRTENTEDFVYRRTGEEREVIVAINYSKEPRSWCVEREGYEVLLNNYDRLEEQMQPYQAVVLGKKV
ncbi:MAG TPA: alpha-glucosidase [Candidatus Limivivens merdigallinarum]|uniref:Alpha-glucosidase n=1 Tax=Candidatus Limivivens merdigallinarum TaxID=2840859 RepID=A0A9D1D073_9FIRM|nr:alpha-glucosidase [Candidatus Limivivens merdigallinarum]